MEYSKEERWFEARERLKPYIDALFWQDLGIPSVDSAQYVNWILDRLFRPEYYGVITDSWSLWIYSKEQEQRIEIKTDLTYHQAKELLSTKIGQDIQGHHWIQPSEAS